MVCVAHSVQGLNKQTALGSCKVSRMVAALSARVEKNLSNGCSGMVVVMACGLLAFLFQMQRSEFDLLEFR
jgi:hypothetical protein